MTTTCQHCGPVDIVHRPTCAAYTWEALIEATVTPIAVAALGGDAMTLAYLDPERPGTIDMVCVSEPGADLEFQLSGAGIHIATVTARDLLDTFTSAFPDWIKPDEEIVPPAAAQQAAAPVHAGPPDSQPPSAAAP